MKQTRAWESFHHYEETRRRHAVALSCSVGDLGLTSLRTSSTWNSCACLSQPGCMGTGTIFAAPRPTRDWRESTRTRTAGCGSGPAQPAGAGVSGQPGGPAPPSYLSKCSRLGVRAPAGSLMSEAVEEAGQWEGQTYWGGGGARGVGGWV